MLPLLLSALAAVPGIPPAEQERDPVANEAVADEAMRLGKAFCSALQARDAARLAALVSADFHARGLVEQPGAEVDAAHFAGAVLGKWSKAALVRRCTFKPFTFVSSKKHDQAVATQVLMVNGLEQGGVRFSDRGDAHVRYAREGKELKLAELELEPRTWTQDGTPEFSEVGPEVGIDRDFPERPNLLTNLVGQLENGGVSVVDYDGDGDLDVYVSVDGPNRLYRNNGDGTFTEVAKQAGVADPGNSRGVLFVDLDNDGDLDLFVANFVEAGATRGNRLYRNNGDGTFTDVTEQAGVGQAGMYTTVVAADVDGDGLLDLYVGQYQRFHGSSSPFDAHNGRPNLLLHNLGGLKFRDEAKAAGVAGREWTLAAAFADLDGDRKPELIVVNDFGSPILYRNVSEPGRLRFQDVTRDSGLVDPGNGMGVDVGDYDNDGLPDIYFSKMYSKAGNRLLSMQLDAPGKSLEIAKQGARGNSLFRNKGGLKFEEVGQQAGVRRGGWAWGCEWGDVDNDGDLDLYVASGFLTGPSEDDL